jgi:hypothetical protein
LFGLGVEPLTTVLFGVVLVESDVGAIVGNSMVAVIVGEGWAVLVADGRLSAVRVNCAATVSAACVKITFASRVGSTGSDGLHATNTAVINNISKIQKLVFLIFWVIDTSNFY